MAVKARIAALWQTHWKGVLICLTVGWLVYELTTQPALGVVVVCFKFALEDVKTGCWLRIQDRNSGRGRSLFWFSLAWGLFKVVWLSFFVIFGAGLCWGQAKQQGIPSDWLSKVQVALIGQAVALILAAAAGTIAAATAWRYRQKVWLDSEFHEVRRRHTWPPPCNGINQAKDVLGAMACGLLLICVLIPGFTVPMVIFHGFEDMPGPAGILLCALLPGVLGILAMVAGQRMFAALASTTLAGSPAECWEECVGGFRGFSDEHARPLPGEEGPPELPGF